MSFLKKINNKQIENKKEKRKIETLQFFFLNDT
jgi:hypothetical protein